MGVQVPLSAPNIIKQLTGLVTNDRPFVFADCNHFCNHHRWKWGSCRAASGEGHLLPSSSPTVPELVLQDL